MIIWSNRIVLWVFLVTCERRDLGFSRALAFHKSIELGCCCEEQVSPMHINTENMQRINPSAVTGVIQCPKANLHLVISWHTNHDSNVINPHFLF